MTGSLVGRRAEIPAWTERWMRGDRYGVITKMSRRPGWVLLTMDKSGAVNVSFKVDDLTLVEEASPAREG